MTNRELMINLLTDPNYYHDMMAYGSMVYYNVACPIAGREGTKCDYIHEKFKWENCYKCKEEWLNTEVGEWQKR